MPKINDIGKYPYDIDVSGSDFLVGTDHTTDRTKNFTLYSIAAYVGDFIGSSSADRVVSIGRITSVGNVINLTVASGGNVVYINGEFFTKQTPNMFPFIPVTTGIKILVVYAKGDSSIFYMAEGEESTEAIEPDLPEGALFIKRIVVTSEGIDIPDTLLADKANITGNNIITPEVWRSTLDLFTKGEVNSKFKNSLNESLTSLGNFSLAGNNLSITYTDEEGTVVTRTQDLSSIAPSIDISGKLDKPTTTITAPDATFKYAVITDDSNNSRRLVLQTWLDSIYFKTADVVNSFSGILTGKVPSAQLVKDSLIVSTLTVSSPTLTLSNLYKNKVIRFTANCAVTIPTGLDIDFNCIGKSTTGVSVSFIIGAGVVLDNDGLTLLNKGVFSILPSGTVNSLILSGDLI